MKSAKEKESNKRWFKRFREKHGYQYLTSLQIGHKTMKFIYERANHKCQFCKTTEKLTVDHIDGKGRHYLEKGLPMNNHPDNLRILCKSCHGKISGQLNLGKTSTFLGVSKNKSHNQWYAYITKNKKPYFIGSFYKEHHAALMWDFWAVQLYGNNTRTNFKIILSG